MPDHDVILYTRAGCHLCDEALSLLRRFGMRPHVIDIDSDDQLRQKYDLTIPVVLIDGRERFRGRINEILLKRILQS